VSAVDVTTASGRAFVPATPAPSKVTV